MDQDEKNRDKWNLTFPTRLKEVTAAWCRENGVEPSSLITDLLSNYFREKGIPVTLSLEEFFERLAQKADTLAERAEKRAEILKEQGTYPISRVETDLEGRIRAIDEEFTRMCGRTIDEVKGKTSREAGLIRDDSDPVQLAKIRTAIKKRKKCVATLVNYRKDGSPYTVLIDMRPLKDGTGFEAFEREVID